MTESMFERVIGEKNLKHTDKLCFVGRSNNICVRPDNSETLLEGSVKTEETKRKTKEEKTHTAMKITFRIAIVYGSEQFMRHENKNNINY